MRLWLILLLVLMAACRAASEPTVSTLGLDVRTFPDLGRDHLTDEAVQVVLGGEPGPIYNSDPATSGPHAPASAPCGIYRQEIPDIFAVHSMEHGAVVVHYDPASIEGLAGLEDLARELGDYIVVVPRSGLASPVVLTAWTKLVELGTADPVVIRAFWDEFGGHGPEQVACPFATDETAG